MDGIVTLVDARHISLHLDDAPEAKAQIAFADRILLNKVDLVSENELEALEERVRGINVVAKIFRTTKANLTVDQVLNIHAFDLDHKLSIDGDFCQGSAVRVGAEPTISTQAPTNWCWNPVPTPSAGAVLHS